MGHFNESISQKLALMQAELITRLECYIKVEEINVGRPTFKRMRVILPTLYLCMKCPLHNVRVRFVKGDQKISKIYYTESPMLKRENIQDVMVKKSSYEITPLGEMGEIRSLLIWYTR